METVTKEARQHDVPVHTMLRLGRLLCRAIEMTVTGREVESTILSRPGCTPSDEDARRGVIDRAGTSPPCYPAAARFRECELPERILISTIDGPHTRLARECTKTVIMVKRHRPVRSYLSRWPAATGRRPSSRPEGPRRLHSFSKETRLRRPSSRHRRFFSSAWRMGQTAPCGPPEIKADILNFFTPAGVLYNRSMETGAWG